MERGDCRITLCRLKRLCVILVIMTVGSWTSVEAFAGETRTIVIDSISGEPLGGASVFDRKGGMLGTCSPKGALQFVTAGAYTFTVR